jgi:hypothetical protein
VKKLIFLMLILLHSGLYSQELMMPVPTGKDSLYMDAERQLMYHQFISGTLFSDEIIQPVPMVRFNLADELEKRWSVGNFGHMPYLWQERMFFMGGTGTGPSPFLRNATFLSGAAYRINDRFSMGGYSFGGNSVFTAPVPERGFNQYDVRGSTLFMQYNVSKNFRIETRVNVTQGPGF